MYLVSASKFVRKFVLEFVRSQKIRLRAATGRRRRIGEVEFTGRRPRRTSRTFEAKNFSGRKLMSDLSEMSGASVVAGGGLSTKAFELSKNGPASAVGGAAGDRHWALEMSGGYGVSRTVRLTLRQAQGTRGSALRFHSVGRSRFVFPVVLLGCVSCLSLLIGN